MQMQCVVHTKLRIHYNFPNTRQICQSNVNPVSIIRKSEDNPVNVPPTIRSKYIANLMPIFVNPRTLHQSVRIHKTSADNIQIFPNGPTHCQSHSNRTSILCKCISLIQDIDTLLPLCQSSVNPKSILCQSEDHSRQ